MKRKLIFQLLAITGILLIFASCEYEFVKPEQLTFDPTDTISFSAEIVPIFSEQSCTNCHSGSIEPNLGVANPYSEIVPDYTTPFEPSNSPIYTKPSPSGTHDEKYTTEQSALVKQWIEQGALDN